ncbi:MAG TPA: bifunctional oligoribonuclease/PAP phosphatase NrnA [Treponema sp.]|nr:bifunctional oligoribonuclease/PAP phosphatase NrnA [Treponema sp.]
MKLLTEEQIASFRGFIANHDFFYIVGHKEPDGDCICSCLALGLLIKSEGKQYQLLSAGPFKRSEIHQYEKMFSSSMQFLSEEERRHTGLIISDCSEYSRLGDLDGDPRNLDSFIIDHHKTASCPAGASCLIDQSAPAACSLVQLLYEGIAGKVSKEAAELLFFGLSTDTGFFRFLTSDSAEVFRAAARLVEAGADPRMTYDLITSGKPYTTRKLLGIMLDRAERYLDGKLIVTYEKIEDTQKWGAEGRDSDSLYQLLLSVKGVEAVVFLRQETEASCTGGFRSRDDVDVSAVAAKFGGGGHKNASGMSVEGRIDTLIPAIVKEFARIM